MLNPDEGYLATEGSVLRAGGVLYRDVVDRKPPFLPYLYALVQRITGTDSLTWIRVLAIVAHVVTAVALSELARRRWGRRAAFWAPVLYLLASAAMYRPDAQAANFEVFMLAFTALAMLWADQDRPVAAGLAVAAAALTKQVGAATMAPVVLIAWWRGGRRAAVAAVSAACAAVVVTALLCGWGRFWYFNVTSGVSYADPSGSGTPVVHEAMDSLRVFGFGAAVLLVGALASVRRWRRDSDIWLWLISSAVGVAAALHFLGHYYLQVLPPLSLLAAASFSRLRAPIVRVLGAAAVVITLVFMVGPMDAPLRRPYAVLAGEVARCAAPGAPIFVWGQFPQLYWETDRPPSSRFVTGAFLTGYSVGRTAARVGARYAAPDAWQDFLTDQGAHPAAVIVDTVPPGPLSMTHYPVLAELVARDYRRVGRFENGVVYVYRRPLEVVTATTTRPAVTCRATG